MDNGTINATVNNGVNQDELQNLLQKVLDESKIRLTDDESLTVSESVETITHELKQKKPKKTILRGILHTLQGIKGTTEFCAAVFALVQFIQSSIN